MGVLFLVIIYKCQCLEKQFPHEEGYRFTHYGDFRFSDSKAEIEIKARVPSEDKRYCIIAMEPSNAKVCVVILLEASGLYETFTD